MYTSGFHSTEQSNTINGFLTPRITEKVIAIVQVKHSLFS